PLRTIQNFVREKNKIQASLLAKRRLSLGTPGRKEIPPGGNDLLDYMVAMREKNFPLTTYHVVQQVKANHQEWVTKDFIYWHGFSRRRTSTAKALTTTQMLEVRSKFLDEFWVENDHFEDSDVINCNETGIYFDTPPWYILAQKGGDASISHSDKSCRLTAVLAAKRNGKIF
ncbi:hypothetical protein AeRB84_008937, partial [Aphanomyces euteiches]